MRLAPLAVLLAVACAGDDAKTPTDTPTPHTGTTTNPTVDPNDLDGDGVALPDDCNDANPSIYPGAPEHCDGIDSDCDGLPDEGMITRMPDRSFSNLADATAEAVAGDELVVCPGTFAGAALVDVTLTIRAFDPSNPPTIDGQGAGATIRVQAPDVRIEGLRIVGGTDSGVLATLNGSVDMVDCVVENNIGRFGGGVQLSPLGGTLEGCVINDNVAQNDGGGLYTNGITELTDVTIEGNVAAGWGGGLAVGAESIARLTDVVVNNNTSERGGGLFALEDTTIDAFGTTTFTDNTASDAGGGIYLWTTTWTGGTVIGNDAVVSGGGIYVYDGGDITGVTVRQNHADQGGGMLLRGTPSLDSVTVDTNEGDSLAGGIYLLDATVTAVNLTVIANHAANGGGVVLQDSSLIGGRIASNRADNGAGIYVNNVEESFTTVIDGVLLEDNSAVISGGGLYVLDDLDVRDTIITRNGSLDRAGGVYATNNAEVSIVNSEVINNTAVNRGGGIYSNDGAIIEAEDSTFSRNQALRGAGMYINGESKIELTTCEMSANGDLTTVSGGGARVTAGDLVSVNTTWGTGVNANLPHDVYAETGGAYDGYGLATFACDPAACDPTP